MATFSAFVALHQYLLKNPAVELAEAIDTVKQIDSDNSGLDYVGGSAVYCILKKEAEWADNRTYLRLFVFKLIQLTQPWWLRLVPYGRAKVRSALEQDQLQCLREAGLFDIFPDAETTAWWDEIARLVRGEVDSQKMARAREAERLSIGRERDRLKSLGLDLEPEWVSLEDNTLGYDIRSYDLDSGQVVSRLIEVKGTLSETIHITRNEWLNAAGAKAHYFFHIWRLPEKHFVEFSAEEMQPNIPLDQGDGHWEHVRVEIPAM